MNVEFRAEDFKENQNVVPTNAAQASPSAVF